MYVGFMTACLPNVPLEELVSWAALNGFRALEVACWPAGQKDRRYAGVHHIDVETLTPYEAERIRRLVSERNLTISSLGYYPNNLDPDDSKRSLFHEHLRKVIEAAAQLGVSIVGTFVGRDPQLKLEDNLETFKKYWPDLVRYAEDRGVKVAIENCPMMYTWPAGSNVAFCPDFWDEMFSIIPSPNFGLNLDPSHLIWQFIDPVVIVKEYGRRILHVHAKDTLIDWSVVRRVGFFSQRNNLYTWWKDKIAGLGDVDWKAFIGALYEVGYRGVISIEHEDRTWEDSEERIKQGLLLGKKTVETYLP